MSAPCYTVIPSPVGDLVVVGDGTAVTAVRYARPDPGHRAGRAGEWRPGPGWRADPAPLADAVDQLGAYFAGERRVFDLPLAPAGTAFQRRVWDALAAIPYGETVSYGALAAAIGRPGSARAVGAANGANPLAVVVPCHRVIGADGTLTGYAGGLAAKQALLALEAAPAVTAGGSRR
ncbi:MAG TPA: methylated-DNA--[protein]-cysteine S-methyltransferase [Acidimicrobiales bacterium]|nr:methylated-DNA--[protein]-cysteine S-methyltransferase [Acidimicrobiales bacterium]